MRWLYYLVYGYIGGLMLFYTAGVFDENSYGWDVTYFVWAGIADGGVLVWVTIYHTVKPPIYKGFIVPVFIFSCIRLGWEVLSFVTGAPINDPVVVAVLFLILLMAVTYIEVIQHKRIKKYL